MLKQYLNYKNLNKKDSIIYLKKKNYKNFFLSIQKDSYNNNNFLNIINVNINKHIIKCFGFFSIELKEIKSLILFENLKTKKFSNNIKDLISFNSIEKRSLKIKNNLFCFKTKKDYFLFLNFFFKTVLGIYFGWNFNLELININYKIYVDIKKKFMTLFIGQSHGNIIKYNSENIFIVLKKKKKLLKLLSFNKKEITYLAYLIKKLRPISKYKNKGIKYEYEIIKFKQGKAKQR